MKKFFLKFIVLLTVTLALGFESPKKPIDIVAVGFETAQTQYKQMLRNATDLTQYPRSSLPDGTLKTVSIEDWKGGFWPGSLWFLYEFTGDEY